MTPTQHSLAYLRRHGYLPAVVERWIPRINRRADLWHFADLLAVHPGRKEFLQVQVTTAANVAARLAKARAQPELAPWLAAGGRFHVHGWRCVDGRWHVRVVVVQTGDLEPVTIATPPRKRRKSRWHSADLFEQSPRLLANEGQLHRSPHRELHRRQPP
jgi:hypothetical protein